MFSLWAYVFAHLLFRALRSPAWGWRALIEAVRIVRQDGWQGARMHLLGVYLPANYLLKTRLLMRAPSSSVYPKLGPLLPDGFFSKALRPSDEGISEPVRILVIRSGAMGDVILATPVIRKLYEDRRGHCRIDVATRHGDVFSGNPHVAGIVAPKALRHLRVAYDLVLDLDMALERNKSLHITDAYALYAFGLQPFDKRPELFSGAGDADKVRTLMAQFRNGYVVAHNRVDPGQPYRHVPVDSWKRLLEGIVAEHRIPVLQVGSLGGDVALEGDALLLDYRDRFSLQELKEVIAGARLFVGTDAGPLHVAACTDTPIVSFFTLAHHDTRQPLRRQGAFVPVVPGIECYGCVREYPLPWGFKCRRGDNACVTTFDMDSAKNACDRLLGSGSVTP